MSAFSTKDGARIPFLLRPNFDGVAGKVPMAVVTRKPSAAAPELHRNDVVLAAIVRAPRLLIDTQPANFDPMDQTRDRRAGLISHA